MASFGRRPTASVRSTTACVGFAWADWSRSALALLIASARRFSLFETPLIDSRILCRLGAPPAAPGIRKLGLGEACGGVGHRGSAGEEHRGTGKRWRAEIRVRESKQEPEGRQRPSPRQ
eukprot:scaffold108934_cov26-Tisochrysis_lutea.AAC.4